MTEQEKALFNAIINNNIRKVEELINNGVNVNAKVKVNYGDTPLHEAAYRGYTEIVQLLLDKGADVNSKNDAGNTPLHIAAYHGYIGITQLLIHNGADLNSKDQDGDTSLHLAANYGNTDVVRLLKQHGAKE